MPKTTAQPLAVNVPEAARQLGLHPQSVRMLIKQGAIPATKLGTKVLVKMEHLNALLDKNRI